MLDWVTFDFAAHAVWCQCLCMGCASSGDLAKHHLGVEGRVLGVLLDCCPSQARHGMASGWDVSELNCFFAMPLDPYGPGSALRAIALLTSAPTWQL
jgi:hypothetical protein